MSAASFRMRLHLAVGALAAIILAATVFAFFSAQEIDRAALRERNAHAVLSAHITISNSAYNLFKQMSDAALRHESMTIETQERLADRVRQDIRETRALIVAEVREFGDIEDEAEEIDRLAAIEREVETIIGDYDAIRMRWETTSALEKLSQIATLLETRVDRTLNRLVSEAIAEERREVAEVDARLAAISERTRTYSILIALLSVPLTGFVLWYVNKSLLYSLRALLQGAEAFARGELEHPIPPLPSREFEAIRGRLNRMAEELAEGRSTLRTANERLEREVGARTAELADANARLTEASAARRALFADVSHELRTPLTVIRGEAEIALRGETAEAAPYRESLARIVEQASLMGRLVEDLLFIARADAGEPRLEMRSVAVSALLADAAKTYESLAKTRRVRLRLQDSNGSAVVLGDRGRLAQVLGILVDNAVRYSREDGEVRLGTRLDGNRVIVSVEDDGIGIVPADMDRVFERFYRADNAQQHSSGVGLGLPVAKAIVEAHNGNIRLSASASGGVAASITLPVETKLRAIS